MANRWRLLAIAIAVSVGFPPATGKAHARPPNVVVLFIDDMGYADPSCFGNPAMKTPNIDRLAEDLRTKQTTTLAAGIDMIMADLKESMEAPLKSMDHHTHALVFLYEYKVKQEVGGHEDALIKDDFHIPLREQFPFGRFHFNDVMKEKLHLEDRKI